MRVWSVQIIPLGDIKPHNSEEPELCECKVKFHDAGYILHFAFDKRDAFPYSNQN